MGTSSKKATPGGGPKGRPASKRGSSNAAKSPRVSTPATSAAIEAAAAKPAVKKTAAKPAATKRAAVTSGATSKAKKSPHEYPIKLFKTSKAWAAWLEKNHASSPGIWMRYAKKKAELKSINYAQALDVALCYGWIDSLTKTFDEESYLQKFTPRGRKSMWSKINRAKVEELTKAGMMRAPGIAAVDAAKADGRWDAAYDSARNSIVPDDLQAALDENEEAQKFFATLDGANRYSVLWRVQTATNPALRAKRIQALVEMLERGEKIHR